MKKKCTPQNNAIVINTPVECTSAVIPTTDVCIDPFLYVWNLAASNSILQSSNIDGELDKILNAGLILPSANSICCPSCEKEPFYSIGTAQLFSDLADLLGWVNGTADFNLCCVSYEMSPLTYNNIMPDINLNCCDTKFSSCSSSLVSLTGTELIQNQGLVEVNSLNNETLICQLVNSFTNLPEDTYLSNSSLETIIENFLSKGFIVHCCDCNIFIGNLNAFNAYALNNNCFSIQN